MRILTFFRHRSTRTNTTLLIGLTLATGGLFKISAFARESFIAARFGLTAVTDAYFGLQQLTLAVATFMFGAFGLAFVPAFSDARRRSGSVEWLPGLLVYGSLIGVLLTALMSSCGRYLLASFAPSAGNAGWKTLVILSFCFVPTIWTGMWAGICTANGRNILSMSVTGFPYLVMTLTLVGLYLIGALNELSLPISMTAGFGLVGLYSLFQILRAQGRRQRGYAALLVARLTGFRAFLKQLLASSLENLGYTANQLLIVYFLARLASGTVSANNCAMRIGMLGYSLVSAPLAQLVQARLCVGDRTRAPEIFRKWLGLTLCAVVSTAAMLFVARAPIIRAVYMHGKFQGSQVLQVLEILPAWIAYFVVFSLNLFVARYMFTAGRGSVYVRLQLGAYAAANALRFILSGRLTGPEIIWCSVAAEGLALLINLWLCLSPVEEPDVVSLVASGTEAA